jgi:hypothetical protein
MNSASTSFSASAIQCRRSAEISVEIDREPDYIGSAMCQRRYQRQLSKAAKLYLGPVGECEEKASGGLLSAYSVEKVPASISLNTV